MIEVTVTYNVNKCKDCPYFNEENDMGAILYICEHPELKKIKWPTERLINHKEIRIHEFPKDCPLLKEE